MWSGIALPVPVGLGLLIGPAWWAVGRRRPLAAVLAVAVLVGVAVGVLHDGRTSAVRSAEVPTGRVELIAIAVTDPLPGARPVAVVAPRALWRSGWLGWRGPELLLVGPPEDLAVGELVHVTGVIDPDLESFRGRAIGGTIGGRSDRLGPAPNPILRLGNGLRHVVLGHLDAVRDEPAGALLAGFLIGDVSALPVRDARALRRAGLSHFVAVSGSNVALFLAAWWIVGGPLGLGPRRRAVFGMVGVVVFAVVTRWEPSVIRASVMAGLVLAGRWAGRPITPWTALGGAVGLSLLVAPGLAGNAGFSLSVAATGGIIAGVPLWAGRRPLVVWAVLGATMSAQVAVAPLLLLWFGSVPLMAPVTNLVAAPVVSASTAFGGIGAVFGIDWFVTVGTGLAAVVLAIARTAADLPQLGVAATGVLSIVGLIAIRARWIRPLVAFGVALAVVIAVAPPGRPAEATVHFLDVGQGDATLFTGPSGEAILIDGGPDPEVLRAHLRRFGIGRIDLLVITHLHADHTTGLLGITDAASVGMLWYPPQEGEGGPFDEVVAEVRASGSPVAIPEPGDEVVIGSLRVRVVAPQRRYANPNDGSVVVIVSEPSGATVVMSGDIEVPAQREVGLLLGDVMKVPHQGAATSDLEWLDRSAPRVAVISVGPNDYGHPSDEVIATLERAGAIVLRTDRDGTVSLPMAEAVRAATALASGT